MVLSISRRLVKNIITFAAAAHKVVEFIYHNRACNCGVLVAVGHHGWGVRIFEEGGLIFYGCDHIYSYRAKNMKIRPPNGG